MRRSHGLLSGRQAASKRALYFQAMIRTDPDHADVHAYRWVRSVIASLQRSDPDRALKLKREIAKVLANLAEDHDR